MLRTIPDRNLAVRVEHDLYVVMSRAVAASGDRTGDPLGTALVVTPVSAKHPF